MATSKVTVNFSCPVKRVWQTVTDLTNTTWRSDLKRVEILDETRFVEHAKSGYATNFTVTAWEPLRRWAFTMENGNMSAHGRGSSKRQRAALGFIAPRRSMPNTGGCTPLSPAI